MIMSPCMENADINLIHGKHLMSLLSTVIRFENTTKYKSK